MVEAIKLRLQLLEKDIIIAYLTTGIFIRDFVRYLNK